MENWTCGRDWYEYLVITGLRQRETRLSIKQNQSEDDGLRVKPLFYIHDFSPQ